MASDGGSYSGSRPQRQHTTVQQTFPTHSTSERSVAASSAVGSVAGPVSTHTWGRGHGHRGPSRGLTDKRLESGQRWNVKVIGGTGIGESGAQFVSHMGIVSKLHCKIWQKDFVKLPADIIDTIFRDLEELINKGSFKTVMAMKFSFPVNSGKSFDDAIASVPAGVNPQDWQIMCAKWNTSDEQERMIQLSTPSLDSESGSTPISAEEAFVSVMGKDRSGRIQVEELRTEARRRDSEMDDMRRELEQLRKRESEMDDIRRQMLQMSTFMTQFQTSQRFVASAPLRAPEDDHVDTDAEGDDYDDDDDDDYADDDD
ncbi:hypothetical protein Taro_025485 [Colocasia esculenta]|uniref:Uncharacterized protein n=1 Tax=Colocasia esculenta TaxID=4460 RepID=A0A843VED5_COLES|nr:hypothetical protein [Colocasia esculenta]